MKYVKSFESHRLEKNTEFEPINEEFIGKLIKGALSKLFQAFSAPFKDLVDDIKKSFKEDDPNSIKNIILTNLNQAIDAAQKLIRSNDIKGVTDVEAIIENFQTTLVDLSNSIGKDFGAAIGDKGKASAASEVAKAVLIGNKEAGWKGIIGLLKDPNYKYSVQGYRNTIQAAIKGKADNQQLKLAQDASSKFFDSFQKDLTLQINKELTEEELKKIYDDGKKNSGVKAPQVKGSVTLNWGGVEITFASVKNALEAKSIDEELGNKHPDAYVILQTSSVKIKEHDTFKGAGEVKKGEKVKLTELMSGDVKQPDYETGAIQKITIDGKEVETYKFGEDGGAPEKDKEELTNKLKDLSTKKPADIKKVGSYVDFLNKGEEDKIKQIDDIIGGGAPAA